MWLSVCRAYVNVYAWVYECLCVHVRMLMCPCGNDDVCVYMFVRWSRHECIASEEMNVNVSRVYAAKYFTVSHDENEGF